MHGRRFALLTSILLGGPVAGGGCSTTTLRASTTQPNPLVAFPNQATHRSQKLFIDVKDMELPQTFKLRQSAYFNVVSKERLRFRVMLVHKWKEIADVTTWKVSLEDDQGRRYYPESKETSYDDHLTRMWDREERSAIRTQFGDLSGPAMLPNGEMTSAKVNDDGYKRRTLLQSVDVFQGAGDFVFHAKGLFHRGIKQLTLTLERDGLAYRFTWNLVDLGGDADVASEPATSEIH